MSTSERSTPACQLGRLAPLNMSCIFNSWHLAEVPLLPASTPSGTALPALAMTMGILSVADSAHLALPKSAADARTAKGLSVEEPLSV